MEKMNGFNPITFDTVCVDDILAQRKHCDKVISWYYAYPGIYEVPLPHEEMILEFGGVIDWELLYERNLKHVISDIVGWYTDMCKWLDEKGIDIN